MKAKEPNAWGLYDTLGNVWEWCEDLRSSNYNAPREGPLRVGRGGSWVGHARLVRAAYRGWDDPGYRDEGLGFRLARGQDLRSSR